MNILIVSATRFEIDPLIQNFEFQGNIDNKLEKYKFLNLNIFVLITGLSYVPDIYLLSSALRKFPFDLAINAGIAGSYNPAFGKNVVVNVFSECFSDFLVEDKNEIFTLFEKKLIAKDDFPFSNGRLANQTIHKNEIINSLAKVNAITSNTIHGNETSINRIKNKFNPDIETMEGAGFFYVCLMEKIPFFQIRSISNMVEPMDKKNWEIDSSVRILNETLLKILQEESHE